MIKYCWQLHLLAELLLPVMSMSNARSARCVTIITGSIIMALLYRFQREIVAAVVVDVVIFICSFYNVRSCLSKLINSHCILSQGSFLQMLCSYTVITYTWSYRTCFSVTCPHTLQPLSTKDITVSLNMHTANLRSYENTATDTRLHTSIPKQHIFHCHVLLVSSAPTVTRCHHT
jgi:hypothetical protein